MITLGINKRFERKEEGDDDDDDEKLEFDEEDESATDSKKSMMKYPKRLDFRYITDAIFANKLPMHPCYLL